MLEVREFSTHQLFGVKAFDHSVRTGIKVACAGGWVRGQHAFRVNMISSEGVAGTQQAIRFERREDAERWIHEHHSEYGYSEEYMRVMDTTGTKSYIKIPLVDFDTPCWTNITKWERTSESTRHLVRDTCEEIYGEDGPDEERSDTNNHDLSDRVPAPSGKVYRGFSFN